MSLDPGAQKLIDLAKASGRPPVETQPVGVARQAVRASVPMLGGRLVEMAEVLEFAAAGPAGPIPMRLYRPLEIEECDQTPAILFFHGGGWVVGDLETHDRLCRALAQSTGAAVIAVDYRLAPENPFPAALEDAASALRYVIQNAEALRVGGDRLGVAGDSAGGNLAAALSIMARDGLTPPVAFQLLLYPICDLTMSHPSYERNGRDYLLTSSTMRYFISAYLSDAWMALDWRASPLLAPDLTGVAPAFVLVAGYDPLCDEGAAYAERLKQAGVRVEHLMMPGQVHGFLTAAGIVTEAGDAINSASGFVRRTVAEIAQF